MQYQLPSKYLRNCVDELSKLPGIGRKSAMRLAVHILNQQEGFADALAVSISELRKYSKKCKICNNISDDEICSICKDHKRNTEIICVVENVQDVLAIEATHQYKGYYHVLGGLISPLDGIGPQQLSFEKLRNRIENKQVKELVFALSATMEGDTTNYYMYKLFQQYVERVSSIARGVTVGNDLESADELSLGRSISQRIDFEQSIKL